jgi:protein NrfC
MEVLSMAGEKTTQKKKNFSRRDFVIGSGTVLAGGALTTFTPDAAVAMTAAEAPKNPYDKSTGYLVYDSRRCAGCLSCMLACSLVHDGETSTSLARIQVSRAALTRYPYDIQIAVCRQCPDPLCVRSCPTDACHVSAENGHVRMITAGKCIGCQACVKACPHHPHRPIWNPETKKTTKCDLCADTPFFSKKGGPYGNQACVATCPMGALKLVAEMPSQVDISGYDVNLAPPVLPNTPPGTDTGAKPSVSGH